MNAQNNNPSKIQVKFRLVPGCEYQYEISDTRNTIAIVGRDTNRNELTGNTKIKFTYHVLTDTKDGYNVIVRFDSFKEDGKYNYKTDMHSYQDNLFADTSMNSLQAFNDAIFKLNVNVAGKIVAMSGYDEFQARYRIIYNSSLVNVKDDTIKSNELKTVPYSENYFKDLFEMVSTVLPENGAMMSPKNRTGN